MKQILILLSLAFVFSTGTAIAQTSTGTKNTKASPKLSDKDIMMCDKDWHIVSVEEWGVVTKPPGDKNKTDMLKLTQDGKFELIMFGNKKSGTWTKSGQYIYFTDAATKGKFNYKVLSVEPTKLRVDHFSEEEGHSIFEYEAK